ncbi:MAG TPA: gephyrin-like molybdotransferase Glp [Gemmataceae bacterium]|nr:gephyrin-like molybdotransferase Glp [Gemmataceae bacterium]
MPMISVTEAQTLVLQYARPLKPEIMPLTPAALGLVLAENIPSDLSMPPFNQALMDGYAVRSADLPEGAGILTVIEEVTAGKTPHINLEAGQATRIMTGAPIPPGADAVVMVEKTSILEGNRINLEDRSLKPGQNILNKGRQMREGDIVLSSGAILRPQEFGLLATVGRTAVQIHSLPQAAIISTGDELVEAVHRPGPGQIRNGNGPMLMGLIARAGGVSRYLGIARDNLTSLRSLITEGLQSDLLILSGGVSAGKMDLVPQVLQELGVKPLFHKVTMKPGKPVFFGTQGNTLVFGLPGNPVSVAACFELFVRPAVRKLRGLAEPGPIMVQATLEDDFLYQSDRPTYHPAWLEESSRGWQARIAPWFGSADLRALAKANAFIVLPAGEHLHRAGQTYSVMRTEY